MKSPVRTTLIPQIRANRTSGGVELEKKKTPKKQKTTQETPLPFLLERE